jgi:ABC-type nitrate/sulfonate/bicarbonate transport system permease component
VLGAGTFVIVGIVWQVLAGLGISGLRYLPTPTEIIGASGGQLASGVFWGAIGHTLLVAIIGWLIGSVIGVVVGTVIGLSRIAQQWTVTSIDVFRAVPVIAILPVMVLIAGLTTKMELYLVIYAALWPVLINTIGGLGEVGRGLVEVSSTLRLRGVTRIAKVMVPAAAAPISVGINLALSISLVIAVLAEIVANPAGVGHQVALAESALQPDVMFVYIAVTGILGLLLSFCLQRFYRLARPGLLQRGEGL